MEWVETTGKTVDDAKTAALHQLGVGETDAEFEIVSEPKAGLFGRVRGEARVRARVRPAQPRPKRTRTKRQGQRRQGQDGRGGGRERASGDGAVAVADPEAESRPAGTGGGGTSSSPARKRRRRSRGGGRGSTGGGSTRSTTGGPREDGADSARDERVRTSGESGDGKEGTMTEELSLEQQGDSAREFVAGVVREMGLDASVTTRVVDADTAAVEVSGSELGLLVGPGGATLSALQELTRTYVQRQTSGRSERIIVDVAGYRARRAEALQKFTRQIAEEVLQDGGDRALEPMAPPDRKVVHDTINEIEGLSTRSEGEEPRRYIVISPTAAGAEGT
jgi:spoIIIJ-associated protein